MQPVNYPDTVSPAEGGSGFTPHPLTFDLNAIRHWTQIDEGSLDDTQLKRLLEPLVGQFEAFTGMAIRNGEWSARFRSLYLDRPLLIPGFAVTDAYVTYDSEAVSLAGLDTDIVGVRKDLLIHQPLGGWKESLKVAFRRGVTATDPLPDQILVACASEVKQVRDGLTEFGKVVKSYLKPFRT